MPLWLQGQGYSLLTISLLTSLQAASRLFAPYLWGVLSDHTGHRVWLLRYCATVALLVSVALWWPGSVLSVSLVLLLLFTHTSGMMPLNEAALSGVVSQQDGGFDAKLYGRIRLWGSLGFLVTVLLAGAWFERHGLDSFPAWSSVTLLAVVASVWWMADQREPVHTGPDRVSVWPVLRTPAVMWFLLSAFFQVLAHGFLYIFFSLYLDSLGYGKEIIGLLWAVAVIVEIAWFFTQGRWLPWLSLPQWLLLVGVVMAVRMAATVAWGQWLWVLVLVQTLHALTFATHHSVSIALINQYFPGSLRGRGQALYTVLAYGLSGVVAGGVGGVVSTHWGMRTLFAISAVAGVLAAGAAWRMLRCPELPAPAGPQRLG